MGSLRFVSVSSSKTGRLCGLRGISSLGSSSTLEAGVDTELDEGEGVTLCRGEGLDELGSLKLSGVAGYEVLGVSMGADQDGWV